MQPAPAPRFSRTRPEIAGPAGRPGQHTDEALASWGFGADEVAKLAGWRARCADGRAYSRLTTGQVRVRVMPSIICSRLTIIRPSSSTESASARTITS